MRSATRWRRGQQQIRALARALVRTLRTLPRAKNPSDGGRQPMSDFGSWEIQIAGWLDLSQCDSIRDKYNKRGAGPRWLAGDGRSSRDAHNETPRPII